jgi:hypothetical protein
MLQRVLTHESVFYSAADDGVQNEGDIATPVLEDPRCIVLMPHKNTAFLFMAVNFIMYEMHVAIIEGNTRKHGVKHSVEAARWIFNNSQCQKLITYISAEHDRALMFAKVCGMKPEGYLKKACQVGGELKDIVLLGATKERFLELHSEV